MLPTLARTAFGIVRVDGLGRQYDGIRAGGVRRTDQGADVARVADLDAGGDQLGGRRTACSSETSTSEQTATTPWEVTVSLSASTAARSTSNHGTPAACGQVAQIAMPGGDVGFGVHLEDELAVLERFADRLRAFDQEAAGLAPERTSGEPAGLLDPHGLRGQQTRARHSSAYLGAVVLRPRRRLGALTSAGRAALATCTSAENAAGSFTARSARILRSTSTSASRRPWMNRL